MRRTIWLSVLASTVLLTLAGQIRRLASSTDDPLTRSGPLIDRLARMTPLTGGIIAAGVVLICGTGVLIRRSRPWMRPRRRNNRARDRRRPVGTRSFAMRGRLRSGAGESMAAAARRTGVAQDGIRAHTLARFRTTLPDRRARGGRNPLPRAERKDLPFGTTAPLPLMGNQAERVPLTCPTNGSYRIGAASTGAGTSLAQRIQMPGAARSG
jgi:hypothetical protein